MSYEARRTSSEYSSSRSYTTMGARVKLDVFDKNNKENLKARGKLYRMLFRYPLAICAVIPSVLFGAVPICSFVFFGKILNDHTQFSLYGVDTLDSIRNWCFWLVGLAVVGAILKFLQIFLWVRMGSRFTQDLKGQLFESLMRNDVAFFDVSSVGGILTLLGEDTQLVQDSFGTTKGTQCGNAGQFLSGIILGYVYNWKLALIATCVFPYAIIIIMLLSKKIDYHINMKFAHTAKLMTMAEESLASIRTVRGFNQEDNEFGRFMKTCDNVVKEGCYAGLFVNVMMTMVMFGVWAVILGDLYYGGTMVDKGDLLAGDLMSVYGFLMFGTMALIDLQLTMQAEQKAISSGARILNMIEHIPDVPFSGGDTIKHFKGHIEFKNVSFKYPTRDVYVLKNVSFEIKAGEMGALVGHSGSGKSTCVQLLERYYDATEGMILLDGKDITSLDPRWLHRKIGLVSQEPILFQTTIKNNITYAKPHATMEEIQNAAEMANARKFIEKLNKGYDFYVGEKGSMISGGQRQRVAIARALIKDPVILITDEATSALDAASEKKVQAALDKIMATRTSVVVAHRLTTVKNANVIYVFDAGEIVEVGRHEELVAKRGFYYELVKRQLADVEREEQKNMKDKNIDKKDKKDKKDDKKEKKKDKKEKKKDKHHEKKDKKKDEKKVPLNETSSESDSPPPSPKKDKKSKKDVEPKKADKKSHSKPKVVNESSSDESSSPPAQKPTKRDIKKLSDSSSSEDSD